MQRNRKFAALRAAAALFLAPVVALGLRAQGTPVLCLRGRWRRVRGGVDGTRVRCTTADCSCRNLGRVARFGAGYNVGRRVAEQGPRVSPDGKWEAVTDNYNVAIRPAGGRQFTLLSMDGSEGNSYDLSSIVWSPDSTKIAAYRARPGYHREIHYVVSSPGDQRQPETRTLPCLKPGDVPDLDQPVLFDVAARKETVIDNGLFPNPYALSAMVWRKNSRAFTFEYNQRGHQVYRVIEVAALTGRARALISEETGTFFNSRSANGSLADSGKKFRYDVDDGKEIIWMSERDGWNHLYLYDGATGKVKRQITKGPWVVRAVQRVDEAKRQIWFSHRARRLKRARQGRLEAAGSVRCQGPRREDRHLGHHHPADEFRSRQEIPEGDLLLIVGELDTNVDPSSTMQVVHQLLLHNKNFDLRVVPGADYPAARGDRYAAYGNHKRFDFFLL